MQFNNEPRSSHVTTSSSHLRKGITATEGDVSAITFRAKRSLEDKLEVQRRREWKLDNAAWRSINKESW